MKLRLKIGASAGAAKNAAGEAMLALGTGYDSQLLAIDVPARDALRPTGFHPLLV